MEGLYYYGARWLDVSLGRSLTADSIIPEATQGVQAYDRYAYANNNPVRYTDPTGYRVDDGCQVTGCEIDWSARREKAYNRQRQEYLDCMAGNEQSCAPVVKLGMQVSDLDKKFTFSIEAELQKPQYEPLLQNQYTPVAFSAISVLATDAQYVAVAILPPPIQPLAIGTTYMIARASGIVSTVATGYQYSHDLYGTTKADVEIAAGTTIISSIPKPDFAFTNHIGLLYTVLRTFGVIPSP